MCVEDCLSVELIRAGSPRHSRLLMMVMFMCAFMLGGMTGGVSVAVVCVVMLYL